MRLTIVQPYRNNFTTKLSVAAMGLFFFMYLLMGGRGHHSILEALHLPKAVINTALVISAVSMVGMLLVGLWNMVWKQLGNLYLEENQLRIVIDKTTVVAYAEIKTLHINLQHVHSEENMYGFTISPAPLPTFYCLVTRRKMLEAQAYLQSKGIVVEVNETEGQPVIPPGV
jgi:hypothetical protein